ncbi:hypothetical protein [Hydrogenovibrio marinus]|uniref:Uncharacterized protein n=1 Tax=Hydrogenovibrio marinus TaxID=28885 RepID=A0A066ZMA4_HYDMR|nr:hypothetical protein [Hydrogenovibrio marinus]KDN94627.1 hypothetical protein EI16_12035 [Hydrogenovibrio marinus]
MKDSVKVARTQINPHLITSGLTSKTKVKGNAPQWVQDAFREMQKLKGLSPQDAIGNLRRSPFFSEEWVA